MIFYRSCGWFGFYFWGFSVVNVLKGEGKENWWWKNERLVNNLVSLFLYENDFEDENRKMYKKNNSGILRGRVLV